MYGSVGVFVLSANFELFPSIIGVFGFGIFYVLQFLNPNVL